ncbi:MAG: hypothetical protein ACE5GK_10285 [Nitrospiria bacterium]
MMVLLRAAVIVSSLILAMVPASGASFEEGTEGRRDASLLARKENLRWGRDPFYRERPPEKIRIEPKTAEEPAEVFEQETIDKTPMSSDHLFLSAIIFRGTSGSAIINDRIVRPGDTLEEGIIVSDILSDQVVLLAGERWVVLRVRPFGKK